MRQIDADALKAQIEKENCKVCRNRNHDSHCLGCMVDVAITYLDEAPTVGGWISVKSSLPKEHPSIFAPFYGTDRWNSAMWRNESDRVLVTIRFTDGTRTVDKGKLQDGIWKTGVSPVLPQEVTHWAVWPEPPKEEG